MCLNWALSLVSRQLCCCYLLSEDSVDIFVLLIKLNNCCFLMHVLWVVSHLNAL